MRGVRRRPPRVHGVVARALGETPRRPGTSRWTFSKEAFDERSHAAGTTGRRRTNAAACRQAALECLADGVLDLLRLGASLECVDDGALVARRQDAGDLADLVRVRGVLERVEANTGSRTLAALRAWQRDVNRIRDHVGEFVQFERTLVRDNRWAVGQREPRSDDVLVLARGKVAEPIEAAADAFIAAPWSGVVAQRAPVHLSGERLLGGEVAGLRLGDAIEAVMINPVRHKRDIIPQTPDIPTSAMVCASERALPLVTPQRGGAMLPHAAAPGASVILWRLRPGERDRRSDS